MKKLLTFIFIFVFTWCNFVSVAEMKRTDDKTKVQGEKKYYVSLSGILAECNTDEDKMELKLMLTGKEIKNYSLQNISESKFGNADATVFTSDTGISIFTEDMNNVNFFPADRFSGQLKFEPGSSVPMEYYFTDAVTNVYVIMTPIGTASGKWYLLKGDPPDFDSTYNTTLYELLGEDGKTTFQCFMQDMNNNNKLILLSPDCNIKNQTEFYLLKEN